MPAAARIQDPTNHPGVVTGPGAATVLIAGMPAARVGDAHTCSMPSNPPHPPSVILKGESSVLIAGQPAARQDDPVGCGAKIAKGEPSVDIGE
jgi:uncharacterized Zn-binding protein involved in type VI secretion